MDDPTTTESRFDEAGQSLAHLVELVRACLDVIDARSVVEIGANRGDLTRELLAWAADATGDGPPRVVAIEPSPRPELLELRERRPGLELIVETSVEALALVAIPDAVIVDGDHNYYTVTEELRATIERSADGPPPLLMLHDVCWPHGRRDTYYAPERVPEEHRQPAVRDAALSPREPGVVDGGLRYAWAAEREGGPRNGVLTAIEDFLEGRPELVLAIVPAFYGLGLVWRRDASWADAVAELLEPWDRNPVLERLETHRLHNLATQYGQAQELGEIEAMRHERERHSEQRRLLRAMLGSRAFAWGERLSRLGRGGRPTFSREQIRRALADGDDGAG